MAEPSPPGAQLLPPPRPAWLRAAPILFVLLWSFGFVFLKQGLAYADPLTFLALRYACVLLLLAPFFLWLRPPLPASARAWVNLGVIGLLLQAGYFSCAYLSLKLGVSAGALALITSQQPILVGLLAPMLAGEKVGRTRWIGLALGVIGASVVILARSGPADGPVQGMLFAVLALLALAAGTLWEKRFGIETHPVTANAIQYLVGLAVTAPLAWWLEPMHVSWTAGLFASLAYLVVANSLIAISLLLAMIRHGEASRVSALFFIVPPATVLIAYIVLGEKLPWAAWPGIALAVGGIYLVMRRS